MEQGEWPSGMSKKADPKLARIAANLWPLYAASLIGPAFATTGNFTKGLLGAALGASYVVMNRLLFNKRRLYFRKQWHTNNLAKQVEKLAKHRPQRAGAGVLKSAALAAAIAWPGYNLVETVKPIAKDFYKYSGLEKLVVKTGKVPGKRKNYDPLGNRTMRFGLAYPMDEDSHISDYFGRRGGRHKGTDITSKAPAACLGEAIYAAEYGYVEKAGYCKNAYGNHNNGVEILLNHGKINGKKVKTRYLHLKKGSLEVPSKCKPKTTFKVQKGDKIAECGSTGRSTGPHLHFEVYVNGKQVTPFEK